MILRFYCVFLYTFQVFLFAYYLFIYIFLLLLFFLSSSFLKLLGLLLKKKKCIERPYFYRKAKNPLSEIGPRSKL